MAEYELDAWISFGTFCAERRVEMGLTQRELAALLRYPSGTVAKIETDRFLPRDPHLIHQLEVALKLPENTLKNKIEVFRQKRVSLKKNFPHFYEIVQLAASNMSGEEKEKTFFRWESRIGHFAEDKLKLAQNFSLFLSGHLSLQDRPKNGLRPLSFYIVEWNEEVDKWDTEIKDKTCINYIKTNIG